MFFSALRAWRLWSLAVVLCFKTLSLAAQNPSCTHGIVASVNPLATEVGLNILKSGGNAVDAAVAVGCTLGVVDPHNSGIGGGCLLLIHLASGKIVAIDGRETAPAAATRDMFVRDGKADTRLSQTGALASGVPGEVAAFEYAARQFGRKRFADLLLPAAQIAERGFPLGQTCANRLRQEADALAKFESSRAIFFKKGAPLQAGEVLQQPELAATYRALAQQGSAWFYRGPFARATAKWMQANAGIIAAADFANYRVELHEPITTTYRNYTVICFPPPSSGGVHLAQMLNIVERFDLKGLDAAARLHVLAETMKLAFADRAYWLGDPAFARVPRGLISKKYAASLARQIDLSQASAVPGHGTPPNWERDLFPKHTTHWSVADADGNWVACTATINTSFGSKVVIPGTGVVMNNQMDDFAVQPGVPNSFGLVGAEANSVAPGKRPLSSMSPTLVLAGRKPMIALGAAGGPKIISAVLQELVAMLDLGKSPAEALADPRIHHQWSPDELVVEKALPADLQAALAQRGYKLRYSQEGAISQIVARSRDGKAFVGAADPRAGGTAAGW